MIKCQTTRDSTQRICHSGQSFKPKSKVLFTPLLDRTPSDPWTMLTTMAEAARISHKAGESVAVFTADQQLYRVALDIYEHLKYDLRILWQGLVVCTGSWVSLGV